MATAMTEKLRTALKTDFRNTFTDVDSVDSISIFEWAVNTSDFYKHFFEDTFTPMAEKAISENRFHKYDRSYRPEFLEWAAWEVIPCRYNDFISYLFRVNGMKFNSSEVRKASDMIYDHYLKVFKEVKG